MKNSHRCILSAVSLVLFSAGYLWTSTVEVQLNVNSGELRKRYTAFGVQTHVSDSTANGLSRAAKSDGSGGEWLTVSERSYYGQSCREDYRNLISCVSALHEASADKGESEKFARCVIQELNISRSLSGTTRHVERASEVFTASNSQHSILECWQSTTQDPLK